MVNIEVMERVMENVKMNFAWVTQQQKQAVVCNFSLSNIHCHNLIQREMKIKLVSKRINKQTNNLIQNIPNWLWILWYSLQ